MLQPTVAWMMLAAWLALAVPSAAQPIKSDHELIQGVWSIVGLESDGKPRPESSYKGNTITFKGNRAILQEFKLAPVELTFKLDSSTSPKAIDLSSPNAAKTLLAIYELKGDELRLCFSFVEGKRPTDFITRAGDQREVMMLRRGPPAKPAANEWVPFRSEKFGFVVDMPGKPEERIRKEMVLGQAVEVSLYVSRDDTSGVSYMAFVQDLPQAPANDQQLQQFLTIFRDNFVTGAQGKLMEEKEFKHGVLTGREYRFSVVGDTGGGVGRLFVVGKRMYGLFVVGSKEGVAKSEKGIARFWGSFKLAGK